MIGRRTLGRAVFFGLGYVAGTRAGREQYARIVAGTKALVETLRHRYGDAAAPPSRAEPSSAADPDPYQDIRLGTP